jgi:hypothetical protein
MNSNKSAEDSKGVLTKPKLSGRLTPLNGILLVLFLVFVLAVVFGGDAIRWGKGRYAALLAEKAETAMAQQEWMRAAEHLREAREMQGDAPEVLRAQANFLLGTRMDPVLLEQTLEILIEKGADRPEDHLELVRLRLAMGETQSARSAFDALSESARQSPGGLKLLAALQVVEGRGTDANRTIRQAFDADTQDPKSGLRLALLNSQNTFPEIQKKARQQLWEYAKRDDSVGMEALGYLINQKDLTLEQVEALKALVDEHPDARDRHRFIVLSALIKLDSTRAEDYYDTEMSRYEGQGSEELVPLLGWLAREKQHTRILRLVPIDVASKSRRVFPIVVQALIEDGRWADLKAMLEDTLELPVPKPVADLWMAEAFSHLEPDLIQAAQRVRSTFETAKTDKNESLMIAAARIAERIELRELTLEIYDELAKLNPKMKAPMMAMAMEQGREKRDGEVMLGAAKRLHAARPENRLQADEMDFLRLVLGEEIELVDLSEAARTARDGGDSDRASLLAALMAYRLWLPEEMMTHLDQVKDVQSMDPGWRAVYAGLMAEADRPARAFEIGEKVPDRLLIDEEKHFLNLAR